MPFLASVASALTIGENILDSDLGSDCDKINHFVVQSIRLYRPVEDYVSDYEKFTPPEADVNAWLEFMDLKKLSEQREHADVDPYTAMEKLMERYPTQWERPGDSRLSRDIEIFPSLEF
ncbi:hypothetical protein FDECE_14293 [Fusarium decemcellulare]|nr:hypothetical protein FDECE_14293 [Fusarium decemcellulare]